MSIRRVVKTILVVVIGAMTIYIVMTIFNSVSMNNMIVAEVSHLKSTTTMAGKKKFDVKDLKGLPEPVQRYFEHVLPPGQTSIPWISYNSSGKFKLPFSDKYFSVTASEYLFAEKPALIFDAFFKHCPFFGSWVHVRDKYEAQKGNMFANLYSGINLFQVDDAKELDQDMFLRYIGHLVLIPTALLPNNYVHWEPIDENHAKLVVADGANKGSSIVTFNETGEIIQWATDNRYEKQGKKFRKVSHIGYRSNYQQISGIKVPLDFKVEKVLPDGTREVFWEGTITDIRFAESNNS
ncbi:MAG: hypothetical protein GY729_20800 [Desulfobacteraceae bacterium]|nr:hypothetical protein [Desulfobacteraceae bacterium]